eukprot:GHUV01009280.1.p1 GENE.GHUV01009280.1~~GHUV01009280.1.p1  ORF type:complete len:278 (+),score=80.75 GHUV01009280.1:161-994(+)
MMKRFSDPYYTVNSVMLLSYCLMRLYLFQVTPEGSKFSRHKSAQDFASWERQSLAVMAAVVLWKGVRRRSLDHFAQQLFFFGHVVTALTALMVDWRLVIWYGLAWWACFAACPQPMHLMPPKKGQEEQILELNPETFKESVQRGEDTWLIYYYTENHDPSIAMAPAIAELAEKYASDKLKFGCFDVGMWPRFAKELKISTQTWSNQLPATVLYYRGQEVARIPAASQIDELGLKRNFYTKADVVKKFGLSADGAAVVQPKASGKNPKKAPSQSTKQR